MPIGIESSHSFGDICFNISLIREIKKKCNDDVWIAIRSPFKDALYNVPWVDKIIEIQQMWDGVSRLRSMGCNPVFQITQNVKFLQFKQIDNNHSLINTPLMTGKELGIENFDNRPLLFPTDQEIRNTDNIISNTPTIAIENVYNSGQSWADETAFNMILDKYSKTHRILWLSNSKIPNYPNIDDLSRFSRRECIMCLRASDIFFSVGSGFFCSSLSLPKIYQPKKIVCLWIDDFYKYEEPLSKYNWHDSITWVHNHDELKNYLNSSTD